MSGSSEQILRAEALKTHFDAGRRHGHATVRAVDGVSLAIRCGEALGLVVDRREARRRAAELLERVGLPADCGRRTSASCGTSATGWR